MAEMANRNPDSRRKLLRDRVVRSADVIVALAALPFAIPLMLVVCLLGMAFLGRPAMFVQERSGLGGRTFKLRKFRSMSLERNADGALLPDDQRLSGFGRILRRSRLDELPQLWNILAGHMSLIGPRPLLPITIKDMGNEGEMRSAVRPGLTGWAQISGNASLKNDDKVALDLWYIRNRSLWLDIKILALTLSLVLFGEHISDHRLMQARTARTGTET